MKVLFWIIALIMLLSWPAFLIYQNSKETRDEFVSRCQGDDVSGLEMTFGASGPQKFVCKRIGKPDEEFIIE